jgi:hypothetical protein
VAESFDRLKVVIYFYFILLFFISYCCFLTKTPILFPKESKKVFAVLHEGFADLHEGFADLHVGFADLHGGFADLHGGCADLHGVCAILHEVFADLLLSYASLLMVLNVLREYNRRCVKYILPGSYFLVKNIFKKIYLFIQY